MKFASEKVTGLYVMTTGTVKTLLLSAHNLDFHDMVSLRVYDYFYLLSISFMLLFAGAIALSSGLFGDDIESAVLYSVDCSGNESEVLNCSFSLTGTCGHSAAVVCQGTNQSKFVGPKGNIF